MRYSYLKKYAAFTMSGNMVTIPDQVAYSQKEYDANKTSFPVIRKDGSKARAILRGEEYGLWTTGTGDAIVRII